MPYEIFNLIRKKNWELKNIVHYSNISSKVTSLIWSLDQGLRRGIEERVGGKNVKKKIILVPLLVYCPHLLFSEGDPIFKKAKAQQ